MKRKNIISLIALGIIVVIVYLAALFRANGNYLDAAISLLLILVPFAFFYIFAVVARNRKGEYVKFWRGASYISFGLSVFFMLIFSFNFMHYFSVISNQDKVSEKVEIIINDYKSMYEDYEKLVNSRVASYNSDLMTLYNQGQHGRIRDMIDPTMTVTRTSVTKVTDNWKVMMFKNYSENKKQMMRSVDDYSDALIDNFRVFSAAKELNKLINEYNSHKDQLIEDFSKQSAIEKESGIAPVFTFSNSEAEWIDVQNIFTDSEFNFIAFIVFLVLGAFACSSYIFFKDSTVRPPINKTSRQDVYSLGHRL